MKTKNKEKSESLKDLVGVCEYHKYYQRGIMIQWLHQKLQCCQDWKSVRKTNEV